MKRGSICFAIIVLCLLSTRGFAEPGKLGLGVILGQPTGISAKYWLDAKTAIDGALSWRYGYHDRHYCDDNYYRQRGYYPADCSERAVRLQLHGDFLWHVNIPANLPGRLPFNFGLGARLITPYTEVGLRLPLGLSFLFDKAPVDVFVELAPVFIFAPYTGGDLDGGIGVRYYFGGPPPK